MRVFVTGATGLIGSPIVRELLAGGHQVLGLARSDASAGKLRAVGAEVHPGSIDDLDSLRSGASQVDGVIHTAFKHDFSDFAGNIQADREAIGAMAEVLAGSDRPLVIAAGTPGETSQVGTEDISPDDGTPMTGRYANERLLLSYAPRGVRAVSVRLPRSVHGDSDKHGFVPLLIKTAREKGVSGYVGDGSARWPAVHVLDAAHLFVLALDAPAGTVLHAIGDEAVPTKEIAEAIGRKLGVPTASVPVEQAGEHWGFVGMVFAMDMPATSTNAQKLLDWQPTRPGLIADIEAGHYFA